MDTIVERHRKLAALLLVAWVVLHGLVWELV